MRGNFFRIHRQFAMGNERRYVYDFFMLCCGPLPLMQWVERPAQALAMFEASVPTPREALAEAQSGHP